ncbi:MAG: ParB/RepB/Spo0J family partition protein [Alphaproteobacteria bacterium]|nr:ParB/RepB/Spo0J family partition protein [Alphaproteobacteria bacterium]
MTEQDAQQQKNRRGLGRGLNALFEDEEHAYPTPKGMVKAGEDAPTNAGATGPNAGRKVISITQLEPGKYQPRRVFDDEAIEELATSLKRHGLLQPIVVRPKKDSAGYEIVAGERRWRAAQRAKLHEVPVIIRDLTDAETLELSIIENLQREDLNAVEEAQALKRLMDEFGHTQEALAGIIGKSRSYVANLTRLLSLPEDVLRLINEAKLSAGHARVLVTAADPLQLANEIIFGGLSVRQAEALGRKAPAKKGVKRAIREPANKNADDKDVNLKALEQQLSLNTGLKVSIDMKDKVAGALNIEFKNLDQLDDMIKRLMAR